MSKIQSTQLINCLLCTRRPRVNRRPGSSNTRDVFCSLADKSFDGGMPIDVREGAFCTGFEFLFEQKDENK